MGIDFKGQVAIVTGAGGGLGKLFDETTHSECEKITIARPLYMC